MPTSYIKKLHDQGHGSISHLESLWDRAKAKAEEQGHLENWGYVTSIFKSMVGASYKLQAKWKPDGGAAGALILCPETGRLLWAKRSQLVDDPGLWAQFGGGIGSGESREQACVREIQEEAGYSGPMDLIPLWTYEDPNSNFCYYNFLGLVDHEFEPQTNHETATWKWVPWPRVPRPLHPGVISLLSDRRSRSLLESYVRHKWANLV